MRKPIEDPLLGGNTTEVTRRGEVVCRQTGPWTSALHEFLKLCHNALGDLVPEVLGFDESGREKLTFLPGQTLDTSPPEILWDQRNLTSAGGLLRQIHDASLPLVHRDLEWRQSPREPREVICHNDFAPYNLITNNGKLSGVIDFDMASPGSRIWDFSYLAYRLVPFAEDAPNYDAVAFGSRRRRLQALLRAYDLDFDIPELLQVMANRLEVLASYSEEQAQVAARPELRDHAAMYRRDAHRISGFWNSAEFGSGA